MGATTSTIDLQAGGPVKTSMKWAGVVLGVFVAVFASAQLVRPQPATLTSDPDHTIQAAFAASSGLASVLDRACGDCHSNTMSSGWYTRVAPLSMIIASGAIKGRAAVNFAEWATYSPEQQRGLLATSCADAKSGRMPMPAYLRVRRDAKLSAGDIEIICGASR